MYRPSWLIVIKFSAYQYKFRNENSVSALIHPVRNHLTVGTRARRTAVSNIGFGIPRKHQKKNVYRHSACKFEFVDQSFLFIMEMAFRSWYTSKKSSRFRNACRAYDWWHHHLISSSRIRYPNNLQKKNSKAPTRHDDIRMSSEKVLNCYHEYQHLVEWTRFYHLDFVMKMICARECSSRGAFGV